MTPFALRIDFIFDGRTPTYQHPSYIQVNGLTLNNCTVKMTRYRCAGYGALRGIVKRSSVASIYVPHNSTARVWSIRVSNICRYVFIFSGEHTFMRGLHVTLPPTTVLVNFGKEIVITIHFLSVLVGKCKAAKTDDGRMLSRRKWKIHNTFLISAKPCIRDAFTTLKKTRVYQLCSLLNLSGTSSSTIVFSGDQVPTMLHLYFLVSGTRCCTVVDECEKKSNICT